MSRVRVLVIDGQGGGLGRQLTAALAAGCPDIELTAVGTNSIAVTMERITTAGSSSPMRQQSREN